MKKNSFRDHDLQEALRSNGISGLERLENIKASYIEKSGDIRVIQQNKKAPEVITSGALIYINPPLRQD